MPGPAIYADKPVEALRVVTGAFQRFPAYLQKVTVLRVHDGRVLWTKAEERRVEHFHIGQWRAGFHIIGVAQQQVVHARRA